MRKLRIHTTMNNRFNAFDLSHYWDLIVVLTSKELKVRYKNNVLGYVWSVANPLAYALVFYIAFKVIMRFNMDNYAIFLITGLFPWQSFANSVGAAPEVFVGNASLIKKICFPRSSVVLAIVIQDIIHLTLSLPVIALFLLLFGSSPSLSWLYGVPVLLLIHALMTFGVALAVATTSLFFRDMGKITGIIINLMFFFTPIMYAIDTIPAEFRPFVNLNPLTPLMANWRNLLLNGYIDSTLLLLSMVYAVIAFLVGNALYRRLSWRFAEVL
jgi:lipopolysaccharide transport system permease protein